MKNRQSSHSGKKSLKIPKG